MDDVCKKPKTQTMINPDSAMTEALAPAYNRWRAIYHLLQQDIQT